MSDKTKQNKNLREDRRYVITITLLVLEAQPVFLTHDFPI